MIMKLMHSGKYLVGSTTFLLRMLLLYSFVEPTKNGLFCYNLGELNFLRLIQPNRITTKFHGQTNKFFVDSTKYFPKCINFSLIKFFINI